MIDRISHVSLVVRDQEEALAWYQGKLGFDVVANEEFPGGDGRWITIAPPAQTELEVVLEPLSWGLAGDDPEDKENVIGRNGFVFSVDDMDATVKELRAQGVTIVSEPEEVPWGLSALIEDLYGNTHNLVEPKPVDTGVPDVT